MHTRCFGAVANGSWVCVQTGVSEKGRSWSDAGVSRGEMHRKEALQGGVAREMRGSDGVDPFSCRRRSAIGQGTTGCRIETTSRRECQRCIHKEPFRDTKPPGPYSGDLRIP